MSPGKTDRHHHQQLQPSPPQSRGCTANVAAAAAAVASSFGPVAAAHSTMMEICIRHPIATLILEPFIKVDPARQSFTNNPHPPLCRLFSIIIVSYSYSQSCGMTRVIYTRHAKFSLPSKTAAASFSALPILSSPLLRPKAVVGWDLVDECNTHECFRTVASPSIPQLVPFTPPYPMGCSGLFSLVSLEEKGKEKKKRLFCAVECVRPSPWITATQPTQQVNGSQQLPGMPWHNQVKPRPKV